METNKLEHYDNLRQDLRDEIKMRITQRDNFAVQYFVSIGALILGAITEVGSYYLFLLLPVVSIYFTTQILYSYYIHDMICYFLREKIEIKISRIINESVFFEWENFLSNSKKVNNVTVQGIRKNFFIVVMWITTFLSQTLLISILIIQNKFEIYSLVIIIISSLIYLVLNINITYKFIFKAKKRRYE